MFLFTCLKLKGNLSYMDIACKDKDYYWASFLVIWSVHHHTSEKWLRLHIAWNEMFIYRHIVLLLEATILLEAHCVAVWLCRQVNIYLLQRFYTYQLCLWTGMKVNAICFTIRRSILTKLLLPPRELKMLSKQYVLRSCLMSFSFIYQYFWIFWLVVLLASS